MSENQTAAADGTDATPYPTAATQHPTTAMPYSTPYGSAPFGQPRQMIQPAAGLRVAQVLAVVAIVGIATRMLVVLAQAHRIMLVRSALGGGIVSLGDANQADSLVTYSAVAAIVAYLAYIVVYIVLRRRTKTGDPLAIAISGHTVLRRTGRIYLVLVLVSRLAMSAAQPSDPSDPEKYLHSVMTADAVGIAINLAVAGILAVAAVATRREIAKSKALAVVQ